MAPCKNAVTDEEFGLSVMQNKYFAQNSIYLDEQMTFFNALGRKGIFLSKTNVYNPFSLLWLIGSLWRKMSKMGIRCVLWVPYVLVVQRAPYTPH